MTIYLRTQEGVNRSRHKDMPAPLKADHPLIDNRDTPCAACHVAFNEGDLVTLVVLGPGDDPEEQLKCRAGRPYNAVAAALHTACATGALPIK